jgi:Zn-finger nucleic acid-binding protein
VNANCPRCQKPLEQAQLDNLTARFCRDCKGMLLAHADLMQVVEASWRAVPKDKAESTPFRTPDGWQRDPEFRCPDCGKTMEKYGYMGLGAIQIDRCEHCSLVWLDGDELQNMVLALAKSNYRSEGAYRREKDQSIDLTTGALPPGAYARTNWLFPEDRGRTGEEIAVAAQLLLSLLFR